MDLRIPRHEFVEGESFEFLYESTDATFATVPAHDGRVSRITDLRRIEESRVRVGFSIVREGETLRKKVAFSDMQFREVTADNLERRDQLPFRSGQEINPDLPEVVSHVYDLGGDGRVAASLGQVFGDYFANTEHRGPLRFIDALTFAAVVENFPRSMEVGQVRTRPAVDVELNGGRFHNHVQFLYFDRIDVIGGVKHAFVKVQSPGNYSEGRQSDTTWVLTAHVPLEGPSTGLVSRGELQEIVLRAGDGSDGVGATVRQNSLTMQTDDQRTSSSSVATSTA